MPFVKIMWLYLPLCIEDNNMLCQHIVGVLIFWHFGICQNGAGLKKGNTLIYPNVKITWVFVGLQETLFTPSLF